MKDSEHHLSKYQRERKEKLKLKVRDFILSNPFENLKSCAEKTGISYQSVIRYAKELKEENEKTEGSNLV